jgi:hypothetical protein
MITIVQVAKHDLDPEGLRTYEVRINQDPICRFEHRLEHGPSRCLLQAAVTVHEASPHPHDREDYVEIDMTAELRVMLDQLRTKMDDALRSELIRLGWTPPGGLTATLLQRFPPDFKPGGCT